jgi:hypothetical protein
MRDEWRLLKGYYSPLLRKFEISDRSYDVCLNHREWIRKMLVRNRIGDALTPSIGVLQVPPLVGTFSYAGTLILTDVQDDKVPYNWIS